MDIVEKIIFLKNLKGVGNAAINKKYVSLIKSELDQDRLIDRILTLEKKLSSEDIAVALDKATEEYRKIKENKEIGVVTVVDRDYPTMLNVMGDKKPVLLYYKGNLELLNKEGIAFVGTRTPTEDSAKAEEGLIKKISATSDYVVVSGLALGCDKIAHESALKYETQTVAVLPSGINNIYPSKNRELAEDIVKNNGCLISEYALDMSATKYSMVERDSIIAALSKATIVVECGIKSGTMHTADAAVKYLRKIACYMPNQLTDKYDGNQMIVKEKGGDSLSTETDLLKFLDKISKKIEENPVQMTLFDVN